MEMIGFNRPFLTGKETQYIQEAVASGKISGNGQFTKSCQGFFEKRYDIRKALLTSSCTDALEMAALLSKVGPGDEVIIPSYTFVSSANPFVMRGATVVFADSRADEPNISASSVEKLITERTKAIVLVHYAGVACDMDAFSALAEKRGIMLIEDAAQAIDSYYKGRPLGSIGDLGTFSFHETKNIISGEGGLLTVNDQELAKRAEIIWEKGTNRAAFWRGEVDKYGWVDIGSSFLASEITAAFLFAQLEQLDAIQTRRKEIWNRYSEGLDSLKNKDVGLPFIPSYATNNAHMFYLICPDLDTRSALIDHLNKNGINAVFHYLSLHKSPFYSEQYKGAELPNADRYSDTLLRLPFYLDLNEDDQEKVISSILDFFVR